MGSRLRLLEDGEDANGDDLPAPAPLEPNGSSKDRGLVITPSGGMAPSNDTVVRPQACPRRINVAGAANQQPALMGRYGKTSTLRGGRPVYSQKGKFYVYYWEDWDEWRISTNYNSVDASISSQHGDGPSCPDMVAKGTWSVWEGDKFVMRPQLSVTAELNDEQTWQQFYRNNSWVLVSLVFTLMVFGALTMFARRWKRKAKNLEEHTAVMTDAHQFSVNVVKHFMPTMSVEKYQFRGMRKRNFEVDIAFKDLSLELASGAKVLEGVTGEFKAGKLCAILGPSGAGKTTFMNVLCGKATYGEMAGEVRINGNLGDISSIKSVTGFVPQDDIVHEELTVREQIRFSAELRNEVGTSRRRLNNVTDDVLNVMQLLSVQGSIVGGVKQRGISGGQRKRVNVGLELAAQPTVLFLDEPTSGLDSTSSLSVVLSLKKMCQLGMTSIMVIHQPRYSLFTLFSDVLLLGKGGRTVYLGPSTGAKVYFESVGFKMPKDENPADWFMDVICGEVSNSREPNFKPPMLWDWWDKNKSSTTYDEEEGGGGQAWEKAEERQMDDSDDRQVLAAALDQEWSQFDINSDGVLQFDELKLLFANCAQQFPSDSVVKELMSRMGANNPDAVTKKEFVDYLMGLRHFVASDMQSAPTMVPPGGERTSTGMRLQMGLGQLVSGSGSGGSGSGNQAMKVKAAFSNGSTGSDDSGSSSGSEADSGDVGDLGSLSSLDGQGRVLSRRTPGFRRQLWPLFQRSLVLFTRKDYLRLGFLFGLSFGAIILGLNDKYICKVPRWEASAYLNTQTALALMTSIFALATYGADQPVFLRDRASGQNVFAYWLSRQIVDLFDIVLLSYNFTALYFVIYQPRLGFGWYLVPFKLAAWAATGYGYVISTLVPFEHGPFITALLIFVVCGLWGNPASLNQFFENKAMEYFISCVSITRWSVGVSFLHANQEHPEAITNPVEQSTFDMEYSAFTAGWGGADDYWITGVLALFIMGLVLRLVSLLLLAFMPRNRGEQMKLPECKCAAPACLKGSSGSAEP